MLDTTHLTAGTGVCIPIHQLRVRPYREILDLGAGPDILCAVFNAVHRANRHSTPQDFAAITLPGATGGCGLHALGDSFVIYGSEAILEAVLEDIDLSRLRRRDMFAARIRDVDHETGEMGTYLVRDRLREKAGSGIAARQARRDARRAAHIAATRDRHVKGEKPQARPTGEVGGFVTLKADRKISFRSGKAIWEGQTVRVSTYGLSAASDIAVLPGLPDGPL